MAFKEGEISIVTVEAREWFAERERQVTTKEKGQLTEPHLVTLQGREILSGSQHKAKLRLAATSWCAEQ